MGRLYQTSLSSLIQNGIPEAVSLLPWGWPMFQDLACSAERAHSLPAPLLEEETVQKVNSKPWKSFVSPTYDYIPISLQGSTGQSWCRPSSEHGGGPRAGAQLGSTASSRGSCQLTGSCLCFNTKTALGQHQSCEFQKCKCFRSCIPDATVTR